MRISNLLIQCMLSASLLAGFTSCSDYDEPTDNDPISFEVGYMYPINFPTPDALSADSPFHVVAFYSRNWCGNYTRAFEADAYLDADGNFHWKGKIHHWPSYGYMRFVAYWPADAKTFLTLEGDVKHSEAVAVAKEQIRLDSHLGEPESLTFYCPCNYIPYPY